MASKSLGGSFRRGVVVVSRWVVNPDGKVSDNFSEAVRGARADRVWLRNSRRERADDVTKYRAVACCGAPEMRYLEKPNPRRREQQRPRRHFDVHARATRP